MSETVESLDIKINATAKSAKDEITNLVGKIDVLTSALSKINGSNLSGLANGVSKLGNATKTLSGVKATDYNRIAKGFERFAKIDVGGLSRTASGLNTLANGLNNLGNIQNLSGITSAVNAVKNLSKVNMAGFDTSKMTEIANSVSDLATKLSGVSAIESTVTRVVGSLSRLSNSGQYIGNVTTEFPILGEQVVKLVGKLSSANAIDISITKVVEGIAKLANAGKRVGETVANLDKLGNGVMNLLKKLQNAPQINSNVANTIQGLGNLASSGSRISTVSDRASTSTKKLGNALSSLKDKLKSAHKSSKGFVSSIGMFYAKFFLVIRAVKKFGQAIGSAQDYIEEFNYFSVALDKVGKDSANQFKKAGYNSAEEYAGSFRKRFGKLQKQLTGYDVDYNTGDATNTFSHNLGLDLTEVMNYNAAIAQITNSAGMLGETSIATSKALTMLSADWASLANLDTADVMQNFQSGLVGQSRALYKYGIDITSAGLAQTAMNHGITESIKNLSQQSKMQLRVLTMLEQSKVAYSDLAKTINSPNNQLRMLDAGFKKLALTLGSLFMPIVQKLYPYMNAVVMVLQDFAQWVAKLAGIKLGDTDGSRKTPEVPDYSNAADDTDKVAKNMDKTAKKTKKAADNLQGFDIVNKLQDNSDSDSGDTDPSGGNANIDLSKDISDALKNYEKIWDNAFKSNQNKAVELYKKMKKAILDAWKGGDFTSLGSALANWINKGMRNIPWTKIKKTTKKIAKSLATFLNGFVKKLDWTKLGENFSEGLNTWFETSYTFFKTFDWLKFGQSIKEGITAAINTFDGDLAGKSLGAKLRGMIQFAFGVMVDFPYKNLGKKIGDYINGFLEEMGEVRKNTGLTGWQELGKTISDGITGILDTIDTALSTVDWWEVGKAIGDFLSEIEWGKTLLKVGKIIVKALFSALKVAISAFARDPLGIALKLSTVIAGFMVYKKFKAVWGALQIMFGKGIQDSLVKSATEIKSEKIASAWSKKFSTIGTKLGKLVGKLMVVEIAFQIAGAITDKLLEASGGDSKQLTKNLKTIYGEKGGSFAAALLSTVSGITGGDYQSTYGWNAHAGGDVDLNKTISRYSEFSSELTELQKKMDELGIAALTQNSILSKTGKNLRKGIITKKSVKDAVGKKGIKKDELQNLLGINGVEKTADYEKAQKKLKTTMEKLNVPAKEQKSILKSLETELKNGEITWEDYKKITDKNYKSTDALKKKIDSLKPKSVKVKAETSGGDDVDSLQGKVDSVNSKTVTITAGIKGVDIKTFGDLSIAMKNMKNRDINVNISANLRKAWYKSVQKELYSRTFSINANTKVIKASGKEVEKATKSQTGKKYNGEKFKKLMNAVGTTQDQWGRVVIPGAIDYNGSSKKAKAAQQSKKWKELIKYLKKYGIATNNPILFANGGFPEDGWFRASHGEMMGKFDNGKSVVANNKQITTGISEAVAPAVYAATKAAIKEELSNANVGGGDVYLDGTKVTTAIMNNAKKISKNKGISWNMA
jgi:hypothetical protein